MRTPHRSTRHRSTRRLATYALLSSLAFAACGKKRDDPHEAASPASLVTGRALGGAEVTKTAEADGKLSLEQPSDGRKVIRTGHIQLVVEKYEAARAVLDKLLAQAGGYVDSTEVNHHQGAVSSATLVIRIPSDSFHSILPRLRELGEIASESTNAADVTDEYVDIAARLASAKTLEKRLLELAADRSSGVEALLAVERELARVRGEVEAYEGKIRQWNDQIALSTLTLTMSTRAPAIAAAPSPGLGQQISDGFSSSIEALQRFGAWLAITATALLPWMVLLIPGFLFGRRAWRRYGRGTLPAAIARPVPAPAPSAEPPAPPA